ncbi:MAG TPA: dTDP-4-dehydrorhamnose reductase [Candidatus Limnocylindria bacterium]|nr:dTDP-4-dehydrorhamnose reductase [Candidatus Limnocylindria bacterium]
MSLVEPAQGPVAVTGAGGRLGRALVHALRADGREVVSWGRPDYDLEDAASAERVVERDRPSLVFHAAAWTDVDGCALDPARAARLNGGATAELARACAAAGANLVYVSTNAVFDGGRVDGRGYAEDDATAPANAYGESKLAGEEAVRAAYSGAAAGAWVARISWLFGAPGGDFPEKVLAAADRLGEGELLSMVADETGRPTYSHDLAAALVGLPRIAPPGVIHLANAGQATRYDWAERVLRRCRPGVGLQPVGHAEYERPASVPRWAVLDISRSDALGILMRPWSDALDEYLNEICPRPSRS